MSNNRILENIINLNPGLAKLVPPTALVDPEMEKKMIAEYDQKDVSGQPTSPYKIALKGLEGLYHDLDVLIPQLNLWYKNNIRYVDIRFSVVQIPAVNAGKFTVLIVPVDSKAKPNGFRDRIAQDGTDFTKSVDLGDLHP